MLSILFTPGKTNCRLTHLITYLTKTETCFDWIGFYLNLFCFLLNWMILFPTTSAILRGVLYRRIGARK